MFVSIRMLAVTMFAFLLTTCTTAQSTEPTCYGDMPKEVSDVMGAACQVSMELLCAEPLCKWDNGSCKFAGCAMFTTKSECEDAQCKFGVRSSGELPHTAGLMGGVVGIFVAAVL